MCGIAGVLRADAAAPVERAMLEGMARILSHRGPDDRGMYSADGIGLVSTRLAVQDLSARGHQPMRSPDGRFAIVYNGEIYNFRELRRGLVGDGVAFQSDSDTEVLLHLLARHGAEALPALRGMFAFAFWDAAARRLLLGRDRIGKKPLAYMASSGGVTFASEAKAILQDPLVAREVDPLALQQYLTYGYVPAPRSAFRGMRQLPAGHVATIDAGGVREAAYWSLRFTPQRDEPRAAAVERLRAALVDATRARLVSDVPVGVLLSGGVDSSAVAAAMRQCTSGRIRTFSVGFDDARFDERASARQVAAHLETEHVELVVRPDPDAMLPALAWHYDQPLADPSAIPTLAISAEARRHVTVALSGDGGDETFLGYDRYVAARVLGAADWLPGPVRRGVARAALALPGGRPKTTRYRARRVLGALGESPRQRYAGFMTVVDDATKATLCTPDFLRVLGGTSALGLLDEAFDRSDAPSFIEAAAHTDLQMYLPGALMAKIDIGSMAHGLEVRAPLLDHALVELVASIPIAHKFDGLTTKALLREAVGPWLPPGVLDRPKSGFGVPLDAWLRGPLNATMRETLLGARALGRGYFNQAEVERLIDEHATGRRHWHHQLWSLLALEWWHRTWIDAGGRVAE